MNEQIPDQDETEVYAGSLPPTLTKQDIMINVMFLPVELLSKPTLPKEVWTRQQAKAEASEKVHWD